MIDLDEQLLEIINKNSFFKNEPMSKHTSFKIGGKADYFIIIDSIEKLKKVLTVLKEHKIKFVILGNGTNVLVKDEGIKGAVLKLDIKNFKIRKNENEVFITVESGMPLSTLSAIALKEEIEGLEFLSGIPGTIGGAIRMNAGAYGREMKDIVVKTRYVTLDGKIKTINFDEHDFKYRHSAFEELEGIIIDTTLKLKKGNKKEIEEKINEYSISRKEHQPLEYPNAGSIFKRTLEAPTAKLIDECGLKGYSIGDAEISTKHAGFIINKGKAKANDVLELINHIRKIVKEKFNTDLELEIIVLGDEK